MSSRSIGRGRCPRCGQEGTIYIRRVGNREYIYFKHGSKWCYIGPRDSVNILAYLSDVEKSVSISSASSSDNETVRNMQLTVSQVTTNTPQSTRKARARAIPAARLVLIALGVAIAALALALFATLHTLNNVNGESKDQHRLVKAKLNLENMTLILPVITENGTVVYKVFKIRKIKTWVEPLNESTIQRLLNQSTQPHMDCHCR